MLAPPSNRQAGLQASCYAEALIFNVQSKLLEYAYKLTSSCRGSGPWERPPSTCLQASTGVGQGSFTSTQGRRGHRPGSGDHASAITCKRAMQRRVGGNVWRACWLQLAGLAGWAVHLQVIQCDSRPHSHLSTSGGLTPMALGKTGKVTWSPAMHQGQKQLVRGVSGGCAGAPPTRDAAAQAGPDDALSPASPCGTALSVHPKPACTILH